MYCKAIRQSGIKFANSNSQNQTAIANSIYKNKFAKFKTNNYICILFTNSKFNYGYSFTFKKIYVNRGNE